MGKENRPLTCRVDRETGCWNVISHKPNHAGYPRIWRGGRVRRAHRLLYEQAHGDLPQTIEVCHSCDNPKCVNPFHLFAGAHKENMADMAAKDRSVAGVKNNNAKLTPHDIRKIRRLASEGMLQEDIALIFQVCHTAIYRIVAGERWRHVQ